MCTMAPFVFGALRALMRYSPAMVNVTKILCPIDFSATSRRALQYAVSVSQKFTADLTVLHVLEQVPLASAYSGRPEVDEIGRAEETVRSQLAVWMAAERDTQFKLEIGRGPTEETILKACEQGRYDLLVMGTHGRRLLDRALFGSVTHRVIRKAPCPVLLVRLLGPSLY
jgi:nucleotide-binding universal stress UspA family protein